MFSLSDVTGGAKAAQAASAAKLSALQKSTSGATHPLAASAQGKSKAPALPGGKAPKGIAKGKGYTFTMGKLSLLAISLSLMLLGGFTFFSGFMVGAWYFGKTAPISTAGAGIGSQLAGAVGGSGSASGFESAAAGEAKSLGLGNIAGSSADVQIQSAIASTNVPGVPSFLQPFVSQVKTALGQKAGSAASQAIQGGVNKAAASKPASTSSGASPASSSGAASSGGSSGSAAADGSSSSSEAGPSAAAGSKSSSAEGDFTVQVGAYAAKENAESMLSTLKMKNYDAYIEDGKESSGQDIYYVRVGHYDSHQMAYTVATNFSDNNIPGATIVKVKDDKKS